MNDRHLKLKDAIEVVRETVADEYIETTLELRLLDKSLTADVRENVKGRWVEVVDRTEMNDLISRQEAIDAVVKYATWLWEMFHEHCNVVGVADALRDVPSAQQWVPCSERLPEGGREILVTEKGGFIRHCEYANYGDFQEFQTVEEGLTVHDVIAWMPLPEPYKGEES